MSCYRFGGAIGNVTSRAFCLSVCLARAFDFLPKDDPVAKQATLLNYGSGQHGYGRCSVASQGSLDEDECDSSEELIRSVAGGGQSDQIQPLGLLGTSQTGPNKLAPIGGGSLGPTTVFRLHFLGSVEVEEEGGRKRRKRLKKHMVEEAVTKIKVRLRLSHQQKLN